MNSMKLNQTIWTEDQGETLFQNQQKSAPKFGRNDENFDF